MKEAPTEKLTSISIPETLFRRIEERATGAGYPSVSSYVTFVLREVVAEEEEEKQPFTPEEEAQVKERLQALGYLD